MLKALGLLGFSLVMASAPALAQDDPELGETGGPAPQAPAQPTPNTWGVAGSGSSQGEWESAGGASTKAHKDQESAEDDHERVVGRIGLGLLGLAEVPVGVGTPVNAPAGQRTVPDTLTAPVIGTRYWLTERFGLEAGLGFMFRTSHITQSGGGKGDASSHAFALHAGLPISLAWGAHYNILAIPYMGLGFSKATDSFGTAATADDVFGKGRLFEMGLRAGVEIQLGAIGLEGFALQLTAGLRMRMEKRSANIPVLNNTGGVASTYDVNTKDWVFATSTGSTLGSSIAGSIAAIYYF
jgi:hypothetical protein